MLIRFSLPSILALFALACGGGGGGGGSSSGGLSLGDGEFFVVDYEESSLNSVSLSSSSSATVSFSTGLVGSTGTDRDLSVASASSSTLTMPQLKMALVKSSVDGNALTGAYNIVAYGKPDDEAQVAVAQFSFDFADSTSPTRSTVLTATYAAGFETMFADAGATFAVANDGTLTWGDWTGGVSAGGNHLLMAQGDVFLVGSKDTAPTSSDYSNANLKAPSILQYDGTAVYSSTLDISFSGGEAETTFDSDSITYNGSEPPPSDSLDQPYTVSGTNNNILNFSSSGWDQGFVAADEYMVLVNSGSLQRPAIVIAVID